MTTPAKLYGKDLSVYDDVDVDELLDKLTAEEISVLAKEVDPDVSTSKLGYLKQNIQIQNYRIPSYRFLKLSQQLQN